MEAAKQPRLYRHTSWIDSRVELRSSPIDGTGMFARRTIVRGETVVIWGGTVFTEEEIRAGKAKKHSVAEIGEGLYLADSVGGSASPDDFMNHSCDPSVWLADEAHGDREAPWRENSFMIPFTGTPAGGGYSTARDLLAFRHAFVNYELLDARCTTWVVTGELPEDSPAEASFGIGVAGGGPGVNAMLEIGREFTVIVLANLDPPSAGDVARKLREMIDSVED